MFGQGALVGILSIHFVCIVDSNALLFAFVVDIFLPVRAGERA